MAVCGGCRMMGTLWVPSICKPTHLLKCHVVHWVWWPASCLLNDIWLSWFCLSNCPNHGFSGCTAQYWIIYCALASSFLDSLPADVSGCLALWRTSEESVRRLSLCLHVSGRPDLGIWAALSTLSHKARLFGDSLALSTLFCLPTQVPWKQGFGGYLCSNSSWGGRQNTRDRDLKMQDPWRVINQGRWELKYRHRKGGLNLSVGWGRSQVSRLGGCRVGMNTGNILLWGGRGSS